MDNSSEFLLNNNNNNINNTLELIYRQNTTSNGNIISRYLTVIGVPVVIIVGLLGSSLSLLIFWHSKLRSQSCTVYLAYLNIADAGFLCSLIPVWLSWLNVGIFYHNGWCQLTVFSSFVFSFLSVWTVVAFTVERYIVVYHPFKRQMMCTRRRATFVICSLTVLALFYYSYVIFTTAGDPGIPTCSPLRQYLEALQVLSTFDTFITMLMPFLSIIILNTAIIVKLFRVYRNPPGQLGFQDQASSRYSCTSTINLECSYGIDVHNATSLSHNNRKDKNTTLLTHNSRKDKQNTRCNWVNQPSVSLKRRSSNHIRTTRSLVLISSTFVLLNTPSHALRVYFTFVELIGGRPIISSNIHVAQELSQFLYYVNFATNVFQYVVFSESFRNGLLALWASFRERCNKNMYNKSGSKQASLELNSDPNQFHT